MCGILVKDGLGFGFVLDNDQTFGRESWTTYFDVKNIGGEAAEALLAVVDYIL